jgi:hypothetical protein
LLEFEFGVIDLGHATELRLGHDGSANGNSQYQVERKQRRAVLITARIEDLVPPIMGIFSGDLPSIISSASG